MPKEVKELKNRLKKDKSITVCGICGKDSNGKVIKKSDAEYLKVHKELQKTCEICSENIRTGVTCFCKGINCYTKDPCNNLVVFEVEAVVKGLGMEVEAGTSFEVFGCPSCAPDKKFHLTKESVNQAYIEFNILFNKKKDEETVSGDIK